MSSPHPLAPWMVQGTSPAPPVSILRAERRPTNITTSHSLRHSSFLGQDMTVGQGAWLNWFPARPHQAQLLHKKNGAPAPGVGWRAGRDLDMAIGTEIPYDHLLECRRSPFHPGAHRGTSAVIPALADE